MTFIWPSMLLSLGIALLLVPLYLRIRARRRRIMAEHGGLGRVYEGARGSLGRRAQIPPALFGAGMLILLAALARPEATLSLPRVEGTLVIVMDTSGSMAADDLAPNRMEAAKEAARTVVALQPASVRIGVVAFSDSGFVVQPPTDDRPAVTGTIDRLAPERGTALANGIFAALNTIFVDEEQPDPLQLSDRPAAPTLAPIAVPAGEYVPAAIVLVTDGENTISPDPLDAAEESADRGVRIHTIGIGSPAGTTLQTGDFFVHTRLEEAALQEIARITGGRYFDAASEVDFQPITHDLARELVARPLTMEITAIFAGTGILLLLAGSLFSFLWFGRPL